VLSSFPNGQLLVPFRAEISSSSCCLGAVAGGEIREWGEMAKGGGGAALLPVSGDAGKGDGEAELFKGSAMTRRGAVAALSYMSCSGESPRSAPLGTVSLSVCGCGVWVELARCIPGFVNGGGSSREFCLLVLLILR
jgi:hypothetical protein